MAGAVEVSCRDLAKRALTESLRRDLFTRSCQETSYRENLAKRSLVEILYRDSAWRFVKILRRELFGEFVQRSLTRILLRDRSGLKILCRDLTRRSTSRDFVQRLGGENDENGDLAQRSL